tara:strand:+ start:419 stop:1303 length:885 start_codon:yes stop_codon:yes gene_type:complete
MSYLKKRYYRIIESIIKRIIKIKENSKNKNFKRTIRSAIYNSGFKNKNLIYSDNNEIKYLMQSYDWVSKKLFIDQTFDDGILKKAVKILKIKKFKYTLINVGAHIGSTCVPAIKRKYFKNLIAFEPSKNNFNLLSANIFINNIADRTKLFNIALSKNKSYVKIKKFQNSGDYRVVKSKQNNLELVKCDILDNYTNKLNKKNSLIFMDAQGHEPFIFLGSKKTFRKKIPVVFEFAPFLMNKNWIKSFDQIFKHYKYFYDLQTPLKKEKLTKQEVIKLYNRLSSYKDDAYTDLLIL